MPKTVLRGRVLKWGHTKGIRLPVKEARRLDVPVGTEVTVTIEADTKPFTLSDVAVVHGSPTDSLDHDRAFADGWARKRRRR